MIADPPIWRQPNWWVVQQSIRRIFGSERYLTGGQSTSREYTSTKMVISDKSANVLWFQVIFTVLGSSNPGTGLISSTEHTQLHYTVCLDHIEAFFHLSYGSQHIWQKWKVVNYSEAQIVMHLLSMSIVFMKNNSRENKCLTAWNSTAFVDPSKKLENKIISQ